MSAPRVGMPDHERDMAARAATCKGGSVNASQNQQEPSMDIQLVEFGVRLRDIPEAALTGFESVARAVRPRGAVVYVLRMRGGHVKCGMSSRPRGRVRNVVTSSNRQMTRWAMTPPILNAREIERTLLDHLGCRPREWSFRTFSRAVAFLSAAPLEFDTAARAEQSARVDEAHARDFQRFWLDTFCSGQRMPS